MGHIQQSIDFSSGNSLKTIQKKAKTKKQTSKTVLYTVFGYNVCGKNIKTCPALGNTNLLCFYTLTNYQKKELRKQSNFIPFTTVSKIINS